MGDLNKTEEQFNKPFLSEQQQALGKQAFQTAVAPLRESLGEQLTQTTESLAKRGAFFGGTGQEQFRKGVLEPRARQESQIAGQIATSLGQTAIDQAFRASEAAKERQSREKLAEAGFAEQARAREFAAGESELGRVQQTSLAEAGFEEQARERGFVAGESELERAQKRELSEAGFEEQARERDFVAGESALERESRQELTSLGFDKEEDIVRLKEEFAGDRQAAIQEFEAEENLLGRRFTREESIKDKLFQQVFNHEKERLAAIEARKERTFEEEREARLREDDKRERVLALALEGNINQDDVPDIMAELLGEDAVLTTEDERDLQRLAASSGLSVEEYTKIRNAIGTAQGELIFGTHFEDSKGRIFKEEGRGRTEVNSIELFIQDPVRAAKFTNGMFAGAEVFHSPIIGLKENR